MEAEAVPAVLAVPLLAPVPLFALLLRLGDTEEAAVAVVPASHEEGVLEASHTAPLICCCRPFACIAAGGDAKASLSLLLP